MRRAPTTIAIALCLIPAGLAGQQSPLRLTEEAKVVSVENTLSLPFVVMIAPRTGEARSLSAHLAAKASAVFRKDAQASYAIRRAVPISWTVPLSVAQAPQCQTGLSRDQVNASLAALRGELDKISMAGAEADRQISLASQIAQLEIDARRDARYTERFAQTKMEWRRQMQRDFPLIVNEQYRKEDQRAEFDETVNQLLEMNELFVAADYKKRSILRDEADILKALVANADVARLAMRDGVAAAAEEAKAGSDFLALIAEHHQKVTPEFNTGVQIQSGVTRACKGAAGVEDFISFTATPSETRNAVVLAEVRFDKGGTQKTTFRRVGTTNRWMASVYWPAEANSLQVRVRSGKDWQNVDGSVSTGRLSLAETNKALEKNIEQLKKRYKTVKFRADGGDGVKTMIIP
jgi:hypothetical protein